jgi:hypothetical protein
VLDATYVSRFRMGGDARSIASERKANARACGCARIYGQASGTRRMVDAEEMDGCMRSPCQIAASPRLTFSHRLTQITPSLY